MTSRWRPEARNLIAETIAAALEEVPALRNNPGALIALVSKAYPQKRKSGGGWSVWLDELALARMNIEKQLGTPLATRCPACKSRPGKPCQAISETDSLLEDRQLATETAPKRRAKEIADAIVHSARRRAVAA